MQKLSDAVLSSANGNPIPGATVTVKKTDGTAATIYSDDGVTALGSNVVTAGDDGEYSFYAANGRYDLTIAGTGFTAETKADVSLFDPTELVGASAEYEGARGDGATDDWAAWTAALATLSSAGGGWIRMQPNKRYALSKRLVIPAKCAVIGHPASSFVALASGFTNTNLAVKYTDTSAIIDMSGSTTAPYTAKDAPCLVGVVIETSTSFAGKVVDGITVLNATNALIRNCKITGLGVGRGIRAASCLGNTQFCDNEIGNFTDNNTWSGSPQMTGIEIDDDRINSVASVGIKITGNYIHDIMPGATFIASHGCQSDGINIKAPSSARHVVNGNTIYNVGEGIDCFGLRCTISGNTISDTYIAGVKLINGAQYNTVTGNTIDRFGRWGVLLMGSSSSGVGDTQGNTVTANTISNGDQSSVWTASGDVACVATSGSGLTYKVKDATIRGNTLNPGANGKYGIWRGSDGTNNHWLDNEIVAAGTSGRVGNGGSGETGKLRDAIPTLVRVYLSANQGIPTGGAYTTMAFDSKSDDLRSEHNIATYATTVQIPGTIKATLCVRMGGATAGAKLEWELQKNGTAFRYYAAYVTASGEANVEFSGRTTVVAGDVITAKMRHDQAGTQTVTGVLEKHTSFLIEAL